MLWKDWHSYFAWPWNELESEKSLGRKQPFCQMNFQMDQFLVLLHECLLAQQKEHTWDGFVECLVSFFFFFLPIVVLLIKHLFKYSFVVGLLLLLLCLNGSVHHLKNGGEGKFTTWPLKPIQPWKNYASPTSICIYSAHLFQRNLGRFFRNRSYSYQIYMVLGLKISR